MKITIIILSAVALALGGLCVFFWRKWKAAISEKETFKKLHQELGEVYLGSVKDRADMHQELHKAWFVLAEKQRKLSKMLCQQENHIWDDAGDGVKRCRRCGKTMRGEIECLY